MHLMMEGEIGDWCALGGVVNFLGALLYFIWRKLFNGFKIASLMALWCWVCCFGFNLLCVWVGCFIRSGLIWIYFM